MQTTKISIKKITVLNPDWIHDLDKGNKIPTQTASLPNKVRLCLSLPSPVFHEFFVRALVTLS